MAKDSIYQRLETATVVDATPEQLAGTCEAALHALWARDAEIAALRQAIRDAGLIQPYQPREDAA